jgi:hypothetical protein
MPKTYMKICKYTAFILVLLATPAFLVGAINPSPLGAQEVNDPNYQFPVLKDRDFQLYFGLVEFMESDRDPNEFLEKNNITAEYAEAIVVKITLNTFAKLTKQESDLTKQYHKSVVFNSSENALYRKYEKRIIKTMDGAE